MFETLRIRPHMEVVDNSGRRIGTVNGVIDDLILLARSGSFGDLHHCVPLDRVDSIDDNRVRLGQPFFPERRRHPR
jgi:hypothetical protein